MIVRAHLSVVVALLALALGGAACNSSDTQQPRDAGPAESAKPKSKLSQEMEAAAASSAAASAQGQGPPPNGVFAPGAADEAQPAGAPPKVTVIKAGDEPKIRLAVDVLEPGTKLVLVVDKQLIQGPLPTMDYTLEVVEDKKDDKDKGGKAKAGASAQPAPSAPAGGRPILLKVKKAELDSKQPGKLPEGAAKVIAKLSGSRITAVLTPAGSLAGVELRVPDEAKDVAPVATALVEALELFFSPMPSEPVGVGGSWIASDRTRINGMPLVRYRVTTLQKVEGDEVSLGVEVRLYATDPDSVPDGVPSGRGVQMLAFNSFGKAQYSRKRASLVPLAGETSVPLVMALGQGGQPIQRGQLKSQVEAEIHVVAEEPKEKK